MMYLPMQFHTNLPTDWTRFPFFRSDPSWCTVAKALSWRFGAFIFTVAVLEAANAIKSFRTLCRVQFNKFWWHILIRVCSLPSFPKNRNTRRWEAQNQEIPVLVSDLERLAIRQKTTTFQHLNYLLRNVLIMSHLSELFIGQYTSHITMCFSNFNTTTTHILTFSSFGQLVQIQWRI